MTSAGGEQSLVRSGVGPIDERLGGLTLARPHLLTGPPGSGKTTVCLSFLAAALAEGRSAALLTQDDPHDVVAQAADLGLDLRRAAATGRFAMACYKDDFAEHLGRTLSAEPLVEELVRALGPGAPDRLTVDSVVPFLDAGSASGPGVTALVHALDRLRSTTLITYPGDVRDYYDRRLDPLVRRCAAVMHLSSQCEGIGRLDVVKARARLWSDSPSFFTVRPGYGVVALDGGASSGHAHLPPAFRRKVLVIPGADGLPDDVLASLRGAFSVSLHAEPTVAMPETLAPDVGAVIVAARWDMINEARAFLRQLRQSGNRTPIVLVTRGDVRSSDRARAVLAGFDDVLADATAPAELIARVTAVVRRGRSTAVPLTTAAADSTSVTLSSNGATAVLDEMRFRVAVESAADPSAGQVFSLLFLSPDEGELDALAALVGRTIRAEGGDLVGVVGARVAVYLPGTRQADATSYLRRVSNEWRRTGRRELRVTQLAYPADRERVRADLRLSAALPHRLSTG